MDYRVRYRDIPWGVAICVLPGKIIGRCIIEPVSHFIKNWKRVLLRLGRKLLIISMVIGCIVGLSILIDQLTDGSFFGWLLHIKAQLMTPAPDAVETVKDGL